MKRRQNSVSAVFSFFPLLRVRLADGHRLCRKAPLAAVTVFLLWGAGLCGAFDPVAEFKAYLAIDTHASSTEASRFIGHILEQASVPFEMYEKSPGMVSLVAHVRGSDPALKPLLLVHHMDSVYPAGPVRTLEGLIRGSAALDDKSLGIAHLAALLEARGKQPRRGIVFVAVCGEEKGGRDGMAYLIEKKVIPEAFLALGEGGRNGIAVDQPLFLSVACAEKGVMWLTVRIPLPAGHGATPGADASFAGALGRIAQVPRFLFEPEILSSARDFFPWYARAIPQHPRAVPSRPEDVEGPFKYMTSTTLNLTAVRTDGGNNVLPTEMKVSFDVRTLKREHHARTVRMLEEKFPGAKIIVDFEDFPAPETPAGDPAFRRLMQTLETALPGLPKGPCPIPGFTDLRYLRARGIPAAGFNPFFVNYYHEAKVHTPEEVIPIERFVQGVALMGNVVHSLCAE